MGNCVSVQKLGVRKAQCALLGRSWHEAAHQVAKDVLMFAGDSPSFERPPIPGRIQIRSDRRGARQNCGAAVLMQLILGVFKIEPMPPRQIRAINGKTHDVGRFPRSNRFPECIHDRNNKFWWPLRHFLAKSNEPGWEAQCTLRMVSARLHCRTIGDRPRPHSALRRAESST